MSHEKTINTQLDSHPLIEWLTCKQELRKNFTENEIETALKTVGYTVKDLTDNEDFENEPYQEPRELVKGPHYDTVRRYMRYKGKEWETTEQALVKTWRITARHQGLKHSKLIHALLAAKLPWFNCFQWEIYEWSYQENYEIYMKTQNGPLYVPITALLNCDSQAITKRMKDYYGDYYSIATINNDLNEHLKQQGRENLLKKALGPLDAIETKRLFAIMNLATLPTIEKSQFDNLKYADAEFKIWVSRMTIADGQPYDHQVTIETLNNGEWESSARFPLFP